MSTTGVDGGMAQILDQYIKLRGTCKTADDVKSVDICKLVCIRPGRSLSNRTVSL